MVNQVVLLFILLLLSGFFSSAETALFSISKTKARHLAKKNTKSVLLIKRMKDDPHRLLSTILIGNNLVNVGAAALATYITINIFPNYAVGIATGIMTFLILVFGEVIPKSILCYPVIIFLNFIPKLTGKIKKTPTVTEEELMTFVEAVEEEGEIKEEEKKLIHRIFEFDDTGASEIMTPRADMFVIEADEKLDLEKIVKSGFTRIPVIEDDIDHVIGIINIKDLFLYQLTSDNNIDVQKIMTEPYFVPENKKLDKLLHQFKIRKHHMAIVVDEYGGVSGLITLEDALEEIVGEIVDESDKEEPHIVKQKGKEWRVLGMADIDEVNEIISMDIPDSKDYDTFSGYVLNTIGRIPIEKEQITIGTYIVTVEEMDGNRVKQYSIKQQS